MSKYSRYWQSFKAKIPTFKSGTPERRAVVELCLVYFGVYLFTTNVCGFTICVGPSMLPTIDANGELALIDRVSYVFDLKDYKIGDVVISKSMDDPTKTVCKRIRGVAGDLVYFHNRNRVPTMVKIPDGHVWLLGDNPSNSNDSRYYGPVPLGLLQGRVFCKIGLSPPHIAHVDTPIIKNKEKAQDKGKADQKKDGSNDKEKTEQQKKDADKVHENASYNLTKDFKSEYDAVQMLQREAIRNSIVVRESVTELKVVEATQDKADAETK